MEKSPIGFIFIILRYFLQFYFENPTISIFIILFILGVIVFLILSLLLSEKRGGVQRYYKDFSCQNCGKKLKFDIGRIGKIKCPDCGSKDIK
jgi:DNA-directed RNA polymerase subunit RPC12/RpoP